MHNANAFHSSPARASAADKGIEWEPMPSLAYLIGRIKPHTDEPVWSETLPADFDACLPSEQFVEPLPGMVLREVTEPDIFRLFFNR